MPHYKVLANDLTLAIPRGRYLTKSNLTENGNTCRSCTYGHIDCVNVRQVQDLLGLKAFVLGGTSSPLTPAL